MFDLETILVHGNDPAEINLAKARRWSRESGRGQPIELSATSNII